MYPRTRLLASGLLAVVLVAYATLLEEPQLLVGAGIVGGWLLARQYAFVRDLTRALEVLTVEQETAHATIRTDDATTLRLTGTLAEPTPLELRLESGVPSTAVTSSVPATTLEAGETTASDEQVLQWPVSGRHEVDAVTVTAENADVRQSTAVGDGPTITVEPRASELVHVGVGGERIGTAYGEHDGGRLGSGDVPAEAREYVPGDTADRIDWKATARFGTTYVREYDTRTDRRTMLVVDHRSTLAAGPTGGSKFDHLREVALSMAETAHRSGDPVGLVTVDDDGIDSHLEYATAGSAYRRIRRRLFDLAPSDGRGVRDHRLTGEEARTHLTAISRHGADDDPFVRTVKPFYEERANGLDHVNVDSLPDGVRAAVNNQHQQLRTAIFTDDSRPGEVRETVALARARGNDVLVFLTPSVLYENDRLTALEQSFDRYVEFEALRRDLSRIDGVTALEVGPGDRLSSVLGAGAGRGRSGSSASSSSSSSSSSDSGTSSGTSRPGNGDRAYAGGEQG